MFHFRRRFPSFCKAPQMCYNMWCLATITCQKNHFFHYFIFIKIIFIISAIFTYIFKKILYKYWLPIPYPATSVLQTYCNGHLSSSIFVGPWRRWKLDTSLFQIVSGHAKWPVLRSLWVFVCFSVLGRRSSVYQFLLRYFPVKVWPSTYILFTLMQLLRLLVLAFRKISSLVILLCYIISSIFSREVCIAESSAKSRSKKFSSLHAVRFLEFFNINSDKIKKMNGDSMKSCYTRDVLFSFNSRTYIKQLEDGA